MLSQVGMKASFAAMIRDHRKIDERAALLKADLQTMRRADVGRAAYGLYELAKLIADHLSVEGQMVADAADGFAQTLAWRHSERKHGHIRRDWCAFLAEWNLVTMATRWPEFRLRARLMLAEVQRLVRAETDQIYLPALRLGMLTEG